MCGGTTTEEGKSMGAELPTPDALLDAPGQACATLTPDVKQAIGPLASGGVLEVRSDDPAAREGIPAWCRLTRNELVAVVADDARHTRFFVRKR